MEPTKHSLAEPFLAYWRSQGGLAVFGYPISEAFEETNETDGKTYLVQYFERNRFEFHPENQPPYDVLLGLLGRNIMELQAVLNTWGPAIEGGMSLVEPIWYPTKPAVGSKFLRGPKVGDGMIVQGFYQDKGRILNLVKDLQFTWIKQQIEWKETESPKGVYHWTELDRVVDAAEAQRVNLLITVVKGPTWATGGFNGFPKDPRDLYDFMKALATRYRGRVGAYEIWNEQNLSGESGDVNPERYVEVLKMGYLGVKAGDETAVVVSGALAPTGVNDPTGQRAKDAMGVMPDPMYLERMYQYNDGEVRKYFDALGAHPYGFNNPPDTGWPDNPSISPAGYTTHNSFYFRRIEDLR
jgi:hypothetical protein